MPAPSPRRGFADQALARAVAAHDSRARPVRPLVRRELWLGVAALAALVTFLVMRSPLPSAPETSITVALNESRNVDVLIDSERTLHDAKIRVVTTGAVELEGFDDEHLIEWQARLERGHNVLSLPVVARTSGPARLVAVIEHAGRTRSVAVNLIVKQPRRNASA